MKMLLCDRKGVNHCQNHPLPFTSCVSSQPLNSMTLKKVPNITHIYDPIISQCMGISQTTTVTYSAHECQIHCVISKALRVEITVKYPGNRLC